MPLCRVHRRVLDRQLILMGGPHTAVLHLCPQNRDWALLL
jgi:hypothetical protein